MPAFLRLAREHENLYGDTSALNLPTRSYAYGPLLNDAAVRRKLVHGSDWPIVSVPPARVGLRTALRLLAAEGNWLRRDVLAKRALGLGDDYWHRAATLLRLPSNERHCARTSRGRIGTATDSGRPGRRLWRAGPWTSGGAARRWG